jgi:hypothetical protein
MRGTSCCGAWTKYGFHEHAFSSGLKAAQGHLGTQLPFKFKDSRFSRSKRPVLAIADLVLRVWILVIQMFIVVMRGYLVLNE